MLFNGNLSSMRAKCQNALRLFSILGALISVSLLSSCTTTNIPGLDQIFFPNSTAKVGPVLDADEQYPTEDEAKAPDTQTPATADAIAPKVTDKVEEAVKPEPVIQPKPTISKPQKNETIVSAAKTKVIASRKPIANKEVQVATGKSQDNNQPYGKIAGKVVLLGENGQPLPAKGTLITLTPKSQKNSALSKSPKRHVIDMKDKEYQPRFSSINVGDQVVFVNKDNIQHNVFSSSGGNAFDLGTYGAGLKRAVTLQEPGIVKIYCNIHADMATFVAVGEQGLSTKADEQGRYQLDRLPLGSYDVRIWNIRGETTRTIDVKENQTVSLIDRIDTSTFTTESHKNKFGGNYSKNAALFEDEFY